MQLFGMMNADVVRTKWERKSDLIQKKWNLKKEKRESCPCCSSYNIHLNHSHRKWHKYWLECWSCHWTEKSAVTIDGAIRKWNRRTCWKREPKS